MRAITSRNYRDNEKETLYELADLHGIRGIERNIDAYTEIGMSGWWSTDKGTQKGLHLMNPIRGEFMIDALKHGTSHQKIIEVGCGGGILCEYLAKAGFEVTGIDQSGGAIEVAKEHARQSSLNTDYRVGDVYRLAFPDEAFDAVISSDFLEHIADMETAISEMVRILGPNGLFIFDTIARNEKSAELYMRLETEGIISPGTHDPLLFTNPDELSASLDKQGVKIKRDGNNPWGFLVLPVLAYLVNSAVRSFYPKDTFTSPGLRRSRYPGPRIRGNQPQRGCVIPRRIARPIPNRVFEEAFCIRPGSSVFCDVFSDRRCIFGPCPNWIC
uniref:3-demethylubiquinone-9 3-methyltransferase n=1 Tax=Candidatus Kentrum sp. TUN TaxID=2126343 RepID=A0A450ZZJ9_9GAMM|nr:MAG: 3-demethylubiquinone-9 3-methyltransferase [Candidatus Kentron sp. TUN]VFK67242.1 MAG: 3-demethylubiquinone-9 3-methyltransferase [Candidatus Kentron sp. TUN]